MSRAKAVFAQASLTAADQGGGIGPARDLGPLSLEATTNHLYGQRGRQADGNREMIVKTPLGPSRLHWDTAGL